MISEVPQFSSKIVKTCTTISCKHHPYKNGKITFAPFWAAQNIIALSLRSTWTNNRTFSYAVQKLLGNWAPFDPGLSQNCHLHLHGSSGKNFCIFKAVHSWITLSYYAQDIQSPGLQAEKSQAHHKHKRNKIIIAMTDCLVILYTV